MAVGENIQKSRKLLGLSQEELGQKLLVSKQVISLWEKNQTVPTIDNLMRLKEVFGISIDEILSGESQMQASADKPNEVYKFQFSQVELHEVFSLQRKWFYKRTRISLVLSALFFIFFMVSSAPNFIIGLTAGITLWSLIFYLKGIHAYNKTWKNSIANIGISVYEYKLFENYMTVNIYRKGEKVRESKCYFTDIEQIAALGKWLLIQFGGQWFIVRRSDLKANSAFYSYMYRNPTKTFEHAASNKWRTTSIILFVASLLSLCCAIALVGAISSANKLFVENMWLFFLITPIPISSIVYGFMLKAKGYQYKKNIIVGIIMTGLLCIYGSFPFIFCDI